MLDGRYDCTEFSTKYNIKVLLNMYTNLFLFDVISYWKMIELQDVIVCEPFRI